MSASSIRIFATVLGRYARKRIPATASAAFSVALTVCGAFVLPSISLAQVPGNPPQPAEEPFSQTIRDYNRRLEQLQQSPSHQAPESQIPEYRIGPQDVVEINVFEASELNRSLRVSESGEISVPLVGGVRAEGLTARQLEKKLDEELSVYIKDPHVGVVVSGIESHPVSVIGEVNQPGVIQVRGVKTLLEVLSLAQGLAEQAGDQVLVMRGAGFYRASEPFGAASVPVSASQDEVVNPSNASPSAGSETLAINLEKLLDSKDPRYNIPIFPGDIVKVTRAGVVYVVGGVKKPGGYALRTNESMSVLKAIALSEGPTSTAAMSHSRIIRTDAAGKKTSIAFDLGKMLSGKAEDEKLQPSDIVFVPNSTGKNVLYKGTEAIVATASGLVIFHP